MPGYKLRPYQEECVNTINALPDGSRAIVALATGLGKTVVASSIKRKGRLLILSHRDELVRQPEKYFDCSYGIEKAGERSDGEEVVSASVQTISQDSRLSRFGPDDFDVVIVDEAHHAAAPSYKKVIRHFHPRLLIGLTATPKRGDGAKLNDVFDKIVFSRDLLWGIQNGYLCDIRCKTVTADVDISKIKFTMGDYSPADLSKAIDQQVMYETVAKTYMDNLYGKGRHTVIYCLTVKGCQGIYIALRHRLSEDEMQGVAIITGSSRQEERDGILQGFRDGSVNVIINCMVLTEGTDLPNIDAIITARPTANESLYTQIVGRGTRLCEGKEYCLLFDIMPKESRKLCTASTLLGMEYEALDKEKKEQLENGEFDLKKFADELDKEEKKRKEQFEKNARLALKEFDFLNSLYQEQMEPIREQSGTTLANITSALCSDIQQQERKAREEDGEYDFRGMYFRLGHSDAERYLFRGMKDDYSIYISRPDMLGNVDVKALVRGSEYRTKEPIPMQEAINAIYNIFTRDCESNFFMWKAAVRRSWESAEASQSQVEYLKSLLYNSGIRYLNGKTRPSKYGASVLIDYLHSAENLRRQAIRARQQAQAAKKEADKPTADRAESQKAETPASVPKDFALLRQRRPPWHSKS